MANLRTIFDTTLEDQLVFFFLVFIEGQVFILGPQRSPDPLAAYADIEPVVIADFSKRWKW